LPDLRGRVPVHNGQGPGLAHNYPWTDAAGVESVTLTVQQIPAHTHPRLVSGNIAGDTNPSGNVFGQSTQARLYRQIAANVDAHATAVQPTGGSQPHDNMQPYLCVNFIISLFGIFPSET
jgi:microcystin-dependent protein